MDTSNPRPSQTLSVTIERSADDVYAYISNPESFLKWAPGFGRSMKREGTGDTWLITTSNGAPARVRFVEPNKFRIVDHYVYPESGGEVYIPMRVLENRRGSEVVFTLFRLPGMTDEEYARDRAAVQKDLQSLKQIMEQ